ncbi:MazG-like pyrophosphatase [Pseudoalteromonas phage HS1]|uniref:MazG-like pyrophosphatase n=1 Tax=Pseudoalteromonas phage H105/1 TaxID=877240 RepID=UPI0001E439C4|nr:MazG-like pyrophosphatase [Pseudoalteromonas phage H105/1]YP_010660091.1 MazG-like pyrophosphatase [Pseudoalteromonas phage HS5]YP_010660218.1 MazG-like pyrophosphatase [Pseudoalteromonas phage HS1]ADM26661.1 transcriptional repressor [Pseudoalteromonas phage H105/1]|tara:strand:- start:225 stop:533 length:309 start_codon:yes stop_codon:yes gene_type:complete
MNLLDYVISFGNWSRDRKIIQNGNKLAQGLKLVSEVGELSDSLAKGRDIKDDIGDCMVVLNNLALMSGTTLEECCAKAWGDIKDRKGHMNEHGVFIKEGDSE